MSLKKIFYISKPIIYSICLLALFMILKRIFKFDINENFDYVSLNFSMFGFSITAFSIVIGFMQSNQKIKEVMKKWHIKQVVLSNLIMLISSIVSIIAKICNINKIVMLICTIFSVVGVSFFYYFIVVLSLQMSKNN